MDKSVLLSTSLHAEAAPTVADPDGVPLFPSPVFLNILWKWNNFVSVRPNYFIFFGYLRKNKIKSATLYKYEPPIQKSWISPCRGSTYSPLYMYNNSGNQDSDQSYPQQLV